MKKIIMRVLVCVMIMAMMACGADEDSFRYIKQFTEPVLLGDGTIFIDKGKYVYVYCSANEFTTGVADENAKLKVSVAF